MELRFYLSATGRNPVQEYLDELGDDERGRILAAFADLAERGIQGTAVELRHIEGKLWEIKVSRHRVFYVVISGPIMMLLHAYKKQGQKAPSREVEVAKARMKEVLS